MCVWRGEGGVGVRVSRRVVVAGSVVVVAVVAVGAICAVLIPSGEEAAQGRQDSTMSDSSYTTHSINVTNTLQRHNMVLNNT